MKNFHAITSSYQPSLVKASEKIQIFQNQQSNYNFWNINQSFQKDSIIKENQSNNKNENAKSTPIRNITNKIGQAFQKRPLQLKDTIELVQNLYFIQVRQHQGHLAFQYRKLLFSLILINFFKTQQILVNWDEYFYKQIKELQKQKMNQFDQKDLEKWNKQFEIQIVQIFSQLIKNHQLDFINQNFFDKYQEYLSQPEQFQDQIKININKMQTIQEYFDNLIEFYSFEEENKNYLIKQFKDYAIDLQKSHVPQIVLTLFQKSKIYNLNQVIQEVFFKNIQFYDGFANERKQQLKEKLKNQFEKYHAGTVESWINTTIQRYFQAQDENKSYGQYQAFDTYFQQITENFQICLDKYEKELMEIYKNLFQEYQQQIKEVLQDEKELSYNSLFNDIELKIKSIFENQNNQLWIDLQNYQTQKQKQIKFRVLTQEFLFSKLPYYLKQNKNPISQTGAVTLEYFDALIKDY